MGTSRLRSGCSANGGAEGRSAAFDGLEYTASYRDLIAAFGINEQAAIHQRIPAKLTRAR